MQMNNWQWNKDDKLLGRQKWWNCKSAFLHNVYYVTDIELW